MNRDSKVLDIRGRMLGGATPLVCTPLVGRTHEQLLAEAGRIVARRPDIVEWRVDHFQAIAEPAAVLGALRALHAALGGLPLIFTRRSSREGGEPIAIGEAEVVALYDAVCASGLADLVDFEMGNDAADLRRVRESARAHGTRLILSHHNFAYTPAAGRMVECFLEAERLGADVAKLAVMPRDRMDVLALLAATAEADAKARIPLVSMSMGPLGSVTRMVGGCFGSSLSFAVGDAASAPGQVPIDELATVLDILRRARGDAPA